MVKKYFLTIVIALSLAFGIGGCKAAPSDVGECTISAECKTLFKNKDKLSKELQKHLPKDGVILEPTKVEIKKGDSVYDVTQRTLKDKGILMEASFTVNKSAYIEGIDNFYEFSAGDKSGWIYSVNDKTYSLSCSEYKVKNGDNIKWLYTCELGKDLGIKLGD